MLSRKKYSRNCVLWCHMMWLRSHCVSLTAPEMPATISCSYPEWKRAKPSHPWWWAAANQISCLSGLVKVYIFKDATLWVCMKPFSCIILLHNEPPDHITHDCFTARFFQEKVPVSTVFAHKLPIKDFELQSTFVKGAKLINMVWFTVGKVHSVKPEVSLVNLSICKLLMSFLFLL